jgi:hypothetical protein
VYGLSSEERAVKDRAETQAKLRHLNDTSANEPSISREHYIAVCQALLQVIPDDNYGIPLSSLSERVAAALAPEIRQALSSVNWYATTVKLDLEGHGLIEYVPRVQPLRVRRARSGYAVPSLRSLRL